MALPTYYNTGTATVSAGGTTVTFAGANLGSDEFPTVLPGDLFTDLAQPEIPPQRIASINYAGSPQTVELAVGWPGAAMAAAPYEIRLVGFIERSTAQTRRYLEMLGQVGDTGIAINAFGDFSDRDNYDTELQGFTYLSLDGDGTPGSPPYIYIKQTSAAGDWSDPIQVFGPEGPIGPEGQPGTAGIRWNFDNSTSGNPGTGNWGLDNAVIASATQIRFSETDSDGNSVAPVLATWDDSNSSSNRGTLLIRKQGDPTVWANFSITSAITDSGTYDSFSVTHIASGGTFTDGDTFEIAFFRTGDVGTVGAAFSRTYQKYAANSGTTYVLPVAPGSSSALDVWVGSVIQPKDGLAYTYSGTTLTLSEDPGPVDVVEVMVYASTAMATLPTGGATGTKLAKASAADLDVAWVADRELLTANRTYYVRTDGSDSNNGLANVAGGAFLTIQKAMDVAKGLDFNGFTVTVQVADGTYTGAVTVPVMTGQAGTSNLVIQGNAGTPANVVVNVTGNNCFTVGGQARVLVKDMELQSSNYAFYVPDSGSQLFFSNLRFGACAGGHILTALGGQAQATGNYFITGGGAEHVHADSEGVIEIGSRTITLVGTPAFSSQFASASGGTIRMFGNTFVGSATGKKFSATFGGLIQTFGAGVNAFPGNTAGTVSQGGVYDGVGNVGSTRETLLAARTYYVRTDGSDANTGLVNSAAGAFLTIQAALNAVKALDLNGFTVVIQLGDGTYTGNGVLNAPLVGGGPSGLTIRGNLGTPGNVIISTTSTDALVALNGARFKVEGVELRTTTGGNCLYAYNYGTIEFANIRFGTCANRHIRADTGALVILTPTQPYSIVGAASDHILADHAEVVMSGSTVTITGTPAFSGSFIIFQAAGVVTLFSVTYSGAATGKRYTGLLNAVLNSFGAGTSTTYFPGNVAGTTATGAQQG